MTRLKVTKDLGRDVRASILRGEPVLIEGLGRLALLSVRDERISNPGYVGPRKRVNVHELHVIETIARRAYWPGKGLPLMATTTDRDHVLRVVRDLLARPLGAIVDVYFKGTLCAEVRP